MERGELPIGFPNGPWLDFEKAKCDIQRFTQDVTVAGGAFSVQFDGRKEPTSTCGTKVYLRCSLHKKRKVALTEIRSRGSASTGYRWFITLEDSNVGVVISKLNNLEHNHKLAKTIEEKNAHSSMRSIPSQLVDFGNLLKMSGQSPEEINS